MPPPLSMSDPRYRLARWRRLREQVIRRDGVRCSTPGCTTDMRGKYKIHVDHIVEVRDGGPFWDPTNLHVLCKPHHRSKTILTAAIRSEPVSPNA